MADKRTEPPGFHARVTLGSALYWVACRGEAGFADPDEGSFVAQELLGSFPAGSLPAWARAELPNKPQLEAYAALSALQALVEEQFDRQWTSGAMVRDPAPYYATLFRRELRQLLPDAEAAPDKKRPPAHDDDWGADSPEEASLHVPRGELIREESDEVLGEARERPLGEEQVGQEGGDRLDQHFAWLSHQAQLLLVPIYTRLTKTERQAVRAVLEGVASGASWHSRGRNSLLTRLSPAQRRAFARACRRFPCLRSVIADTDCKQDPCSNPDLKPYCDARSRLRRLIAEQRAGGAERKRNRRGGVFLALAREREQAGFPEIAAGLRAIDKYYRGYPLSEEELAQAKQAQKWGREECIPGLLRENPLELLVRPALASHSVAKARELALDCLRLALLCWPQGGDPERRISPGR